MKITIGFCDDSIEQIEILKNYLFEFPIENELIVFQSTDPEKFLTDIEQFSPQLVFLDIDMEGMNGIDLGYKLKCMNQDIVIVYITAYEKYALEAFRVRAFHYLLKPVIKDKFYQVLAEAIRTVKENSILKNDKLFTLQKRGETLSILYNDILCFEKMGHKIKVHTVSSDHFYYGNLSQLTSNIDKGHFIQCHQGYVVNIDKIRAYRDKVLILDSNIQIPVSRSFSENTKKMLAKKLFAGGEQK